MRSLIATLALLALAAPAAAQERTPAPRDARAYIVSPANGEIVSSPVKVRFGLSGMGVAPAGFEKAGTGHHHLLIDTSVSTAELEQSIPADDEHLHFGAGQTETVVDLAPGDHTLQLLLGDHNHRPHDPAIMSTPIVITVR